MHKHLRNLPLLRAELPREPNNLFNRHHLARVLRGLGEDDEAAEVLTDAVEVARWHPYDQAGVLVFTDLIRLRRARGEDVDELLAEARALYPENKLLWWIEAAVDDLGGAATAMRWRSSIGCWRWTWPPCPARGPPTTLGSSANSPRRLGAPACSASGATRSLPRPTRERCTTTRTTSSIAPSGWSREAERRARHPSEPPG